MHATAQCAQLRTVALAAVNRQHMKARNMGGVTLERFRDLNRQFAGWRQHQRLRRGLLEIDTRQDRQRKSGSLAGAGLRLSQYVAIAEQDRDSRRLYRGR